MANLFALGVSTVTKPTADDSKDSWSENRKQEYFNIRVGNIRTSGGVTAPVLPQAPLRPHGQQP
jgi:peptidoglycan hydrolase-like protein with peptidoglycan-binding domain